MVQLLLDFPVAESHAEEDFLVSATNADAWGLVEHFPNLLQSNSALIYGESGSGKTHLGECWRARHNGVMLDVASVGTAESGQLWSSPYALLENIETIQDEIALFHLLRHAETTNSYLLLTAQPSAKMLPFTLPDLRSRLLALPCAGLLPPNEEVLVVFMNKFFADRQIRLNSDVIPYILKRSERSFGAVKIILEQAEKISLTYKKEITLPLLKTII